jgi:hypothetical protein
MTERVLAVAVDRLGDVRVDGFLLEATGTSSEKCFLEQVKA